MEGGREGVPGRAVRLNGPAGTRRRRIGAGGRPANGRFRWCRHRAQENRRPADESGRNACILALWQTGNWCSR